jgi:hypothetical protein
MQWFRFQQISSLRQVFQVVYLVLVVPVAMATVWLLVSAPSYEQVLSAFASTLTWILGYYLIDRGRFLRTHFCLSMLAVLLSVLTSSAVVFLLYLNLEIALYLWHLSRLGGYELVKEKSHAIRWIDEHGGMVMAIPFVLLFLFLLHTVRVPLEQEKEVVPMKVLVELTPPEPEPEPEEIEPEVVPLPETDLAATRKNSPEDPEVDPLDPVVQDTLVQTPLPEVEPLPEAPKSLLDWIPTVEEAREISRLKDVAVNHSVELEQQAIELREYIIKEEVSSSVKDFEFDSDGGIQGAMRLLNIEGFPKNVVNAVLKKYGITQGRSQLGPGGGRGFLNAAVTEQGTYTNKAEASGYYDVLELSKKAMYYMSTLETEALMNGGYNPKTSRIIKITFGIVVRDDGLYDLGVVDLEIETIR